MPTITATEFRFTTEDYHRMIDIGVLTEDDRVELIDGKITPMAAVGNRHVICVNRLNRLFVEHTNGAEIEVSIQNPVQVGLHWEPEPDLALIRAGRDRSRVPQAADALLVIEVSDSTLRHDREVKLPRYAAAGIPEAWIIDVEARRLDVFRQPTGGGYAQERRYRPDDEVSLPHTEKTIRLGDLFS